MEPIGKLQCEAKSFRYRVSRPIGGRDIPQTRIQPFSSQGKEHLQQRVLLISGK